MEFGLFNRDDAEGILEQYRSGHGLHIGEPPLTPQEDLDWKFVRAADDIPASTNPLNNPVIGVVEPAVYSQEDDLVMEIAEEAFQIVSRLPFIISEGTYFWIKFQESEWVPVLSSGNTTSQLVKLAGDLDCAETGLEVDLPKARANIIVPGESSEDPDVVSNLWLWVYNRGTRVHFERGLLGFTKYLNGRNLPLFIPLDCPGGSESSDFGSDV